MFILLWNCFSFRKCSLRRLLRLSPGFRFRLRVGFLQLPLLFRWTFRLSFVLRHSFLIQGCFLLLECFSLSIGRLHLTGVSLPQLNLSAGFFRLRFGSIGQEALVDCSPAGRDFLLQFRQLSALLLRLFYVSRPLRLQLAVAAEV